MLLLGWRPSQMSAKNVKIKTKLVGKLHPGFIFRLLGLLDLLLFCGTALFTSKLLYFPSIKPDFVIGINIMESEKGGSII